MPYPGDVPVLSMTIRSSVCCCLLIRWMVFSVALYEWKETELRIKQNTRTHARKHAPPPHTHTHRLTHTTLSSKFYNSFHNRACNRWDFIWCTFFIVKRIVTHFEIQGKKLPKSCFPYTYDIDFLFSNQQLVMSVTGWRQLSGLAVLHM